MKIRLFISLLFFTTFISFSTVGAQNNLPNISANGAAIYGWKDGKETPILLKKENYLFPIASLTKLVTAKVAESLYLPDETLKVTSGVTKILGITPGITPGKIFTRDELLKALLINSSNDAAEVLAEKVGPEAFVERMNYFLHDNNYTSTEFINPSGLDPSYKSGLKPNRMTPLNLTRLLNDIYINDPVLREIMSQESAVITDQKNNIAALIKQTNALFRDKNYKDLILMSKTGLTNMAGQNVAFVAPGNEDFDYYTIVLLGSKSRNDDSKKVLNWLNVDSNQS